MSDTNSLQELHTDVQKAPDVESSVETMLHGLADRIEGAGSNLLALGSLIQSMRTEAVAFARSVVYGTSEETETDSINAADGPTTISAASGGSQPG